MCQNINFRTPLNQKKIWHFVICLNSITYDENDAGENDMKRTSSSQLFVKCQRSHSTVFLSLITPLRESKTQKLHEIDG